MLRATPVIDVAFLPGLELSRVLFEEGVRPILAEAHPELRYAAARVGTGSEVLGFDTPRSADHEWGPRLELFLAPADAQRLAPALHALLAERLPKAVRGWPTNFRESTDPADPVGRMELAEGPVNHRVRVLELGPWLTERLGVDAAAREPATLDWLAMPQQALAEATEGAVFHDDLGSLTAARRRLAWYPDQVWRYLLAAQWGRISQEEAFVGRADEVGDGLGAAVVAARLARDVMRLAFLFERRYAPYSKWLGSAFARLPAAEALGPPLRAALAATDAAGREAALCTAYEAAGRRQNATGLTPPLDPRPRPYHGRPYLVLHAERFAQALAATIDEPDLRRLPLVGGVDQWADSPDLLDRPGAIRAALRALG
jgi:uncharacterized protein DUF4037